MKTALLILQLLTLSAMLFISSYSVELLFKINPMLAIYWWGNSFYVYVSYLKKTEKLWFNKEDHHA